MNKILIKKSLLNLRMFGVVIVVLSIFIISLIVNKRLDMSFSTGTNLLEVYMSLFAFSPFVVFAGLFPGIPYAYSYLEECNSGYLKYIEIRMNRGMYRRQKIVYSGISGGISLAVPVLLIFFLLDYITCDVTGDCYPPAMLDKIWGPYILIWGGRFVLALKVVLVFLFGFMWAEVSLMCSLIFKNKYIAMIVPFILYEVTWLLFNGRAAILTPISLVRSDFDNTIPIWLPFLIDLGYILILSIANYFLFKRREKYEG